MKSRSHRPPLPTAPMDSWEDGSWTVDCSCGVNFDDGEEMVDCDECGVWVHTRCSGFNKGDNSFTCEKCEAKRPRSSSSADQNGGGNNGNSISVASDNEETEVAQLLVELPTKADTLPPPSMHQRPAFRLWTQIPMEERVHVNGVPGGDPALFQGIPSVISSSLWKCTGYVPKKFNFKYKDFPCLDSDESDNPTNTGANLLFSLSKETVPYGAAEVLAQMPSLRGSMRRDDKVLYNNDGKNSVKKDRNKLHAFSISSSKKKEELPMMTKGSIGKKKGMTCGYKASVNNKKKGSAPTTTAYKLDHERIIHSSKPDFQGVTRVNKGEDTSSEPPHVTGHEENDSGNSLEQTFATGTSDAVLSVRTGNRLPLGIHVKLEKFDDHDMRAEIPSKESDLSKANYGKPNIGADGVKEEDVKSDGVGSKQLLKGSDHMENQMGALSAVEKGKNYASRELVSNASNLLNLSAHPDSNSEFSQGPKEAANIEELISENVQAVGNLDMLDPSMDIQKLDFKKSSTLHSHRQVDGPPEDLQIHMPTSVCEPDMQKSQDGEMKPESRNEGCDKFQEMETCISSESKKYMLEQQSTSGTTDILSEKHSKSSTKDYSAEGAHKLIVSVGKGSPGSSQPDISKLPITHGCRSPATTPSASTDNVPVAKRLKSDNGSVAKTDDGENVVCGVDAIRKEMPRKIFKTHTRSSRSLNDKTSQKKIYHPSSKLQVAKESSLSPASKTSTKYDTSNSSGPGKTPGSSKNQSNSVYLKFRTSGSMQRNERTNSSGSHTSGKFSNYSAAMHSPSSANASATISDEELAKRLHQELNSSPRVSRVSRGFPVVGMSSGTSAGSSMLSKRSTNFVGKYQALLPRRKNKDELHVPDDERDGPDHLRASVLSKQQASVTMDGSQKDSHKRLIDAVPSSERSAEPASNTDDD